MGPGLRFLAMIATRDSRWSPLAFHAGPFGAKVAVFDLEGEVWRDAGDGGEEVVEDLFGGHAEFSAARGDFEPAGLVPVVAFGEALRAQQDQIAVVG